MKNTYQLKVELQVEAPRALVPDEVEALWRAGLTTWLDRIGFSGEVVSVEAVAIVPEIDQVTEHLIRYLVNAEKRTGQKWEVVERYKTISPRDNEYDRALLRAEDGSTVRIYYRWRCWVRGQKVLRPKSTQ